MVDCEVQDPSFKGKAKDITNDAVIGDYWSPKLAPYVDFMAFNDFDS